MWREETFTDADIAKAEPAFWADYFSCCGARMYLKKGQAIDARSTMC